MRDLIQHSKDKNEATSQKKNKCLVLGRAVKMCYLEGCISYYQEKGNEKLEMANLSLGQDMANKRVRKKTS